jgi:hypothetical protein
MTRDVSGLCAQCGHVWLWHGTAHGCTRLRVAPPPAKTACGCPVAPPWKIVAKTP